MATTVAAANSFQAVADEWLTRMGQENRSEATMKKLRWLTDYIKDMIGKRPIARPSRPIAASCKP